MSVRPGVAAREFVRALRQKGFALVRSRGSHRIYRHSDGRRVVVAYHGLGDSFPLGTLKSMIKSVNWSDEDLRNLGLGD